LNFLHAFSKNAEIPNFIKIPKVGAEMLQDGGRTDMTKFIVAFRNFSNVPENVNPGK
jgi:hypothetical protein